MRARLAFLVFALVLPAFAGCLDASDVRPASTAGLPLSIEVPDGAALVEEAGNQVLRWANVSLPFESTFIVPAGVTIVRAVTTLSTDAAVSAYMLNDETGRRRCNTDVYDAWDLRITRQSVCSGLAAIDPPGATWRVRGTGPLGALATVDIVFETTPLDGLAGKLDLTQLSMPTYGLQETRSMMVPSFDGTPLYVEVTLPEGPGPWPTVLASSPYNGQYNRDLPSMWAYFTHDWAKRGYAIVNADVRGFGYSGGCVEIWSDNEQKDQAFLVDWVAEQDWSDGKVGFYGQSYVGTTPVAAAVQAPDALKAIIAVAPVINAYYDWHFGGVPNGENSGSPVAYQVLTDMPPTPATPNTNEPGAYDPDLEPYMDPLALLTNKAKGLCDPALVVRANDPRAIYDGFYEERNFSARVKDVKAAVLYTQGFEDSNVKSAMIPWWFNEIDAPKLGIFGHWVHQHPTRADEEIMFLGWMDQYVKGKPVGFDKGDAAEIVVDDATFRTAAAWPPVDAEVQAFNSDFAGGMLGPDAAGGNAQLVLAPRQLPVGAAGATSYTLKMPVETDLSLAGTAVMAIEGMLMQGGNAYFYGAIYDDGPEGSRLMTYGMFNLAHRNGHDTYTPGTPGETMKFGMPFLPTEHVFRAGHTLRLVLSGTSDRSEATGQPGVFMLHGGEATQLVLPGIDVAMYTATPATALR